jgi:tRNA nucleotidyltransferase/poly(A) polymerase
MALMLRPGREWKNLIAPYMKPPQINTAPKEKRGEIRPSPIASSRGFRVYLSGVVRDIILCFDVDDFDFATNARPAEERRFSEKWSHGQKDGTVTVLSGGRPTSHDLQLRRKVL